MDQHDLATAPAPPRRVRALDVAVRQVIRETRDAATLVLTADAPVAYAAGQFLSIDPHQLEDLADLVAYLEDAKARREPSRAYSLSSSPLERDLAFTVKEERYVRGATRYPPLLSPWLVRHARPGLRLRVLGFAGSYVLPPDVEDRTDHVVHVVAGSGSVPSWSIVKYALAAHPRLRQTFVYSNRTWDDVIFRDGLAALAAAHPRRLRVLHTLTRDPEADAHGARHGRVDAALLREAIPDPGAALVYACGPAIGPWERAAARARGEEPAPRFLETVRAALHDVGVPRERVLVEAYG